MSGRAEKTLAVVLMIAGFPFMVAGVVAGFAWDHVAMGWMIGRTSSDWIGGRLAQHFPRKKT